MYCFALTQGHHLSWIKRHLLVSHPLMKKLQFAHFFLGNEFSKWKTNYLQRKPSKLLTNFGIFETEISNLKKKKPYQSAVLLKHWGIQRFAMTLWICILRKLYISCLFSIHAKEHTHYIQHCPTKVFSKGFSREMEKRFRS